MKTETDVKSPKQSSILKVEWNIDHYSKNGARIGEVQLWADVKESDAERIKRAVYSHEPLLGAAKLARTILIAEFDGYDNPILTILEHAIRLAEGK